MRVFINGFGRIGRSVLRAWAGDPARWPGLEIVGINDIAATRSSARGVERLRWRAGRWWWTGGRFRCIARRIFPDWT